MANININQADKNKLT